MENTVYNQLLKDFYNPSAKAPVILKIPPLSYAMIDGDGDPNTSKDFKDAISALYAVSYGIKMLPKKGIVPQSYFEYKVSALEGLWDMPQGVEFTFANKDKFTWTLMIMQPSFVTPSLFEEITAMQKKKKGIEALAKVRLQTLDEGLCCQMLHIGSYDDEPATFGKMHRFIEEQGYKRTERSHHEIYMSDARKTAKEKLKTILRFKVVKM